VYSYSHREIRLAFGTWRTKFLAALKIVHAIWLSAGRGHHLGWLASALCRAGLSHCHARLRSRRRPRARTACPNLLPRCCPPARSASLLLASPTDVWRPDRRPCSACTLPCPAVAVVGRGLASTSLAAALGTAQLTPWPLARLENCRYAVASASRLPCPCLAPAKDVPCQGSLFVAAAMQTAVGSMP